MIDLRHGDCFEVLAELEAGSIDACVTDPPYGIGFMGREWDTFKSGAVRESKRAQWNGGVRPEPGSARTRNPNLVGRKRSPAVSPSQIEYDRSTRGQHAFQSWCQAWAVEVLRVLKPGAHLVVCGAPRSYHRMVCGLEDAGFEIRDSLIWMFGQGFPKSLDVSKAIDKAAGVPPDRVTKNPTGSLGGFGNAGWNSTPRQLHYDTPTTDDAKRWAGWGTALKPSYEPIVLARKPLDGTVAANALRHGTGALNIDGCRIPSRGDGDYDHWRRPNNIAAHDGFEGKSFAMPRRSMPEPHDQGRWPANVVLDEEAAAMLDAQSGRLAGGSYPSRRGPGGVSTSGHAGQQGLEARCLDSGGASRFYYVAKPSRAERDQGCAGDRNAHPTVKPIDLMRWLVRLVTPPGGVVLDPFMGSGTTGMACQYERLAFIGIEREAEWMEVARRRVLSVAPLFAESVDVRA